MCWSRTSNAEVQGIATYYLTYAGHYMKIYHIDTWYIFIRMNRRGERNNNRTITVPAAGRQHEHVLDRYVQGWEGRAVA